MERRQHKSFQEHPGHFKDIVSGTIGKEIGETTVSGFWVIKDGLSFSFERNFFQNSEERKELRRL
jgi:hypothetical protein